MSELFRDRWKRWDDHAQAFWAKAWKVVGPLFYLLILAGGVKGISDKLDQKGWIRHSTVTPVAIAGDWFVGEFKTCYSVIEKSGEQGSLDCSGQAKGSTHVMPVHYWGRLRYLERISEYDKYKDYKWEPAVAWKCQRGLETLTCWAQ